MVVALIVIGAVLVELLLAVGVGRFLASGEQVPPPRDCAGSCCDPVAPPLARNREG